MRTKIRPKSVTTNTKGEAVFQVSDTLIQKVIYRATISPTVSCVPVGDRQLLQP